MNIDWQVASQMATVGAFVFTGFTFVVTFWRSRSGVNLYFFLKQEKLLIRSFFDVILAYLKKICKGPEITVLLLYLIRNYRNLSKNGTYLDKGFQYRNMRPKIVIILVDLEN